MQHHAWVLIQRNGEALTGEDDFPPELAKLNCKCFILRLPALREGMVVGVAPDMEMEVPAGYELIFKRRTQVVTNETNGEQYSTWKYVVGIEPLKQERSGASNAPS